MGKEWGRPTGGGLELQEDLVGLREALGMDVVVDAPHHERGVVPALQPHHLLFRLAPVTEESPTVPITSATVPVPLLWGPFLVWLPGGLYCTHILGGLGQNRGTPQQLETHDLQACTLLHPTALSLLVKEESSRACLDEAVVEDGDGPALDVVAPVVAQAPEVAPARVALQVEQHQRLDRPRHHHRLPLAPGRPHLRSSPRLV